MSNLYKTHYEQSQLGHISFDETGKIEKRSSVKRTVSAIDALNSTHQTMVEIT